MDKVKNQKTKVKDTGKKLEIFIYGTIIFFLVFFLFLNIFSSQRVSPLYYQITNNNRRAVVEFLKKIKTLPEFSFYLTTNIGCFDRFLENEVFGEQRKKEEKITELKSILIKNPKSRDALYNLYLLNKELNKNQEAEKYLKLAKEIDPEIK